MFYLFKGKQKRIRPIVSVNDAEVKKRQESRVPANTRKQTMWCLAVWEDWIKARRSMPVLNEEFPIVERDITEMDVDKMNFWLSKFVLEVRKTNGDCFYPSTMYNICCGLQRYLRDNGRPEISLWVDYSFKSFRDSLDGEMKRLTSLGVGAVKKQAEAFSREQEDLLWKKKLLGDHNGQTLLNTLVFLIGKFFSLRGGKEHRSLTVSQMRVEEAKGDLPAKICYASYSEKNFHGGLKHRKLRPKVIEHFSNTVNPERCLVRLFKLYMSKW